MKQIILIFAILLYLFPSISFCQTTIIDNSNKEPVIKRINFTGPRLGFVTYNDHYGDILKVAFDIPATLTQFGWENELRFKPQSNGLTGTTKLIWLFAGFERGVFLPQLNCQVGLITQKGLEFGIGPYLSFTGPALSFSLEKSYNSGALIYPISFNFAVQEENFFFSVLFGFEAIKECE